MVYLVRFSAPHRRDSFGRLRILPLPFPPQSNQTLERKSKHHQETPPPKRIAGGIYIKNNTGRNHFKRADSSSFFFFLIPFYYFVSSVSLDTPHHHSLPSPPESSPSASPIDINLRIIQQQATRNRQTRYRETRPQLSPESRTLLLPIIPIIIITTIPVTPTLHHPPPGNPGLPPLSRRSPQRASHRLPCPTT